MKQRVAGVLATVWLASIVGASVPSGETTAFSTPSPDQYTPLLRKPHYYSQDDYGQDWMNDEPSRMKVANRQENLGQMPITDSDRSLPLQSAPNEFYNRKTVKGVEDIATPYRFQSKDIKTQIELDREAMRLSSIKLAFDEPIDSEVSDNTSEEDFVDDGIEEEEPMQQDEFFSDGTFEDEGPGSVEVYKLDLYKDKSILSPKPSRKNWLKNKSKIPKKVDAVDQIVWKSKDPEESKQRLPKISSRFDSHSDEFSPSRSFKDRIFGVGGVPELQVGCEGVEVSQRQKRSDSSEVAGRRRSPDQSDGVYNGPPARATPLYIDADYEDEDEDLDTVGGTDELFRILSQATTTTESPLTNKNRGDMDPRVKTPGDLEKPKKEDKLPIRGDLGPSSDQNLTSTIEARHNISAENQPLITHRRKLMSFAEEELAENSRNKRNSDLGFAQTHAAINGGERRGHRGHRGSRLNKEGERRRRHESRQGHERGENELRKRNKAIDRNREDNKRKRPEDDIRENRLASAGRRNEPSNLLHQLPVRKEGRNEDDYSRRYEQQMEMEKRSEKERRTADENERKLENYRRRNTPIPRRQRTEGNQRTRQQHQQHTNQLRTNNSKNQPPQNIRIPLPPVYGNQRNDRYADNRSRLQEQRQQEVGHTNRAAYEQKLKLQEEQRRQSTERSHNHRQGKSVYKQRSQQEIDRLNALPVSAYIYINQQKPNNGGPKIEGRFGGGEIAFPGLNPGSSGRQVPEFPSPATSSPPVAGPSPCTWAIMTCCSNRNRLATCFEAKGCYQGHWDDPCSQEKMLAALEMVNKYYGG